MKYKISGSIAQSVLLGFESGDSLWASNGALMSYSQNIQWDLRVPGGFGGAFKRSFAGEGIALTYIQAAAAGQTALLSANQPGKIVTWDLAEDGPVVTTRGSFLAAWGPDIDITVTVARRAGAALFGGAGLFLQQVSGSSGTVLIHGSGDFIQRKLEPAETIMVSTGNLAAFADEVDYDIRSVGGCGKILFSREGFFVTALTGPGRVLLQTLKRHPVVTRSSVQMNM